MRAHIALIIKIVDVNLLVYAFKVDDARLHGDLFPLQRVSLNGFRSHRELVSRVLFVLKKLRLTLGSLVVDSWLMHGALMVGPWLARGSLMLRSWISCDSLVAHSWLIALAVHLRFVGVSLVAH